MKKKLQIVKRVCAWIIICITSTMFLPSLSESNISRYNVEVYRDDTLSIVCDSITDSFVEFKVTSLLKNNSIEVDIESVALDGIIPTNNYAGSDYWLEIGPKETATMHYYAKINNTNHKYLSMYFTVFNKNGNGYGYAIDNAEIGGTFQQENTTENGLLLYDSSTLAVEHIGNDENGMVLRINNKTESSITLAFDVPIIINEKEYPDTYVSVQSFPPHSIGDYVFRVVDFEMDYSPDDISSYLLKGYTFGSNGYTIDSFILDSQKGISTTPDSIIPPEDKQTSHSVDTATNTETLEDYTDVLLDPDYLLSFYNVIATHYYLNPNNLTPALEKQWRVDYAGNVGDSVATYVNGFNNLYINFTYDEYYQVEMMVAMAMPTDGTNKTDALIPLYMAIDFMLDSDNKVIETAEKLQTAVDILTLKGYEIALFAGEDGSRSIAITRS